MTWVCQDIPATADRSLTLDLLAPPIYVAPPDGATSDPVAAGFSWNAPAPGSGTFLYVAFVSLGTYTSSPLYVYSVGTSTSFKVPDPALFGVSGVSVPAAADSDWLVQAISSPSLASADALLGGTSSHALFSTCVVPQKIANGADQLFTTP